MTELFAVLPKGSISEILADRIIEALINKELKPGDKLPTEAEFSEKLGVSRNAVREAVKILTGYGVLEVRRAEGTFVVEKYNPKLLNPLLYGVILMDHSIKELLDVKIALANAMLYTAISNASDEEIQRLREYGERYGEAMHHTPPDPDDIYEASRQFRVYLGEICHNPMLMQFDTIVHRIAKFTRKKAIEESLKRGWLDQLPDNYMKEVDILERRDRQAIPDFMDERLALWEALLIRDDIET